jgi:hypothetical protein
MTLRFLSRRMPMLGVVALVSCTSLPNSSRALRTETTEAHAPNENAAAKTKAAPASSDSALDAELTGLRHQIANGQSYNDQLHATAAAEEQKLRAVLAGDRSAGPTVEEFDLRNSINAQLGKLDGEARAWQQTIDAHKAVLAKARGDPRHAELQVQIEKLSEQRAELLRQRARVSAINDKLKQ